MLAYRHAFHAGNHADVLKHTVLTLVLPAAWGGLAATAVLWLGMLLPIVWAFARSRPAAGHREEYVTGYGEAGSVQGLVKSGRVRRRTTDTAFRTVLRTSTDGDMVTRPV